MDIKKLFGSFSKEEKQQLLFLLTEESVKSDDCRLLTWAKNQHLIEKNMSVRLYYCLERGIRNTWGESMLLSELTFTTFIKQRNNGQRAWHEFIELRGY